jgi:hypothetical protein
MPSSTAWNPLPSELVHRTGCFFSYRQGNISFAASSHSSVKALASSEMTLTFVRIVSLERWRAPFQ